jgi:putative ABC transport system permease protein
MKFFDYARFATSSLRAHPLRSALTMAGIAVGIAAVILLTSIGQGLHEFVLAEFSQFGTNIITMTPGRVQTHGGSVGAIATVRPLTIEDAMALRVLPQVEFVNASVLGNVEVRAGNRTRRVTLYGEGSDFSRAFNMKVAVGRFLPPDDPRTARPYAVLGAKARDELFGEGNPLGAIIRTGGSRFRVVGVMESKGQVLGFDLDDTVFIPVGRALELFNREGVMEVNVAYRAGVPLEEVVGAIKRLLVARHGREDFTVTPQQQLLDTLSTVLNVLTFAVGSLGGISLLVGGVGIVTIMTISVSERVGEIGLLRALGARQELVLALFLIEAALLAILGGSAGFFLGAGIAWLLETALPALPVSTPWSFVVLALAISAAVGLISGAAPARRASRLDPVEALRDE